MDFSYFFNTSVFQAEKLIAFGFIKKENNYFLEKDLDDTFYAKVVISKKGITLDAVEKDTNEIFVLLDVVSASGKFIGELREKAVALMEQIRKECFLVKDVKERYIKFLESKFSAIGDFPWESETDYEVFRCQNGKWFALLMKIPISKLGIKSEEKVYVVNLKSNSVSSVIDKRTIFPAWHMNKKYWITVLLSPVIDFDLLCDLTLASYKLVSGK